MRAADDFEIIRARMEQLRQEREGTPLKHDKTSWRADRDELNRVVQEKTRELLKRV